VIVTGTDAALHPVVWPPDAWSTYYLVMGKSDKMLVDSITTR